MKLLLILFITIFNLFSSQTNRFNFKASYQLSYQIDSTNLNRQTENFVLLFNEKGSYFTSNSSYEIDSLTSDNLPISSVSGTGFSERIFTIIGENKVSANLEDGSTFFYYDFPVLNNWKITNVKKTIQNLACTEATTFAYGRFWKAYFSPQYPFSYGPYFFSGLPGIIVEVEDDKGYYKFTLENLKKNDSVLTIDKPLKELNKVSFYKLVYEKTSSASIFNKFSIPGNPGEKERLIKLFNDRIKTHNNFPIDKTMRYLFN